MSKISKHFTESEMQCKCNDCGNSCPMDTIFLILLDRVRFEAKSPIKRFALNHA